MNALVDALLPLIADLSADIGRDERYGRLLAALQKLLPCDAVALLKRDRDALTPVAASGLSLDTLGRRFLVRDQPRLQHLLEANEAVLFAPDSDLPDPYDGLIASGEGLQVHDCAGCRLSVHGRVWGVLTLDALTPGRFDAADLVTLNAFAKVAAAAVLASERITDLTHSADEARRTAQRYRQAADAAAAQPERRMLGQSPAFLALQEEIATVAESDLTVLITGETGTGKELVADAIHRRSLRRERPMIAVNCAALPDALVESELFGHVKGAFSGAQTDRRGKFDLADGGTLFLDEIGELPLLTQAKLLRVLQGGQLQRLGSDRDHRVDVRILAASNRNLADEVRAGRFRADLYHRLAVYALRVPPLRERDADVVLLAGAFLEQHRSRLGVQGLRLSRDARQALLRYDWPGNVRELEHAIGRAALRANATVPTHLLRKPGSAGTGPTRRALLLTLDAAAIGLSTDRRVNEITSIRSPAGSYSADADERTRETIKDARMEPADATAVMPLRDAIDNFQKDYILHVLKTTDANWARAARTLHVDPANLTRLARRLRLK